jgi:hypothetical protein
MSNDYYTATGKPTPASRALSADLRSEFASLQSGLDKLPSAANVNGGAANLGTDSGAANAYVVTASTQIVSLFDGLTIRFKASASNTGASTINVNGLGAKSIVRPTGSALAAGDVLSGQFAEVAYSSTNDNWQLALSATGATPASFSGTAAGTIDLLTGNSIASASTVNLNSATGNLVHVTGTTTINAVTLTRGPRWVVFDGQLTLTHNATTNNLPGGSNILTQAGDRAMYWSDGTTVYCIDYVRGPGMGAAILLVRDEKTAGTGAGSATTGSFITRTLNTVAINEISGASLATNQITLPAGSYEFEAIGTVLTSSGQASMAELYNVTDSAVVVTGLSVNAGATNVSDAVAVNVLVPVRGKFTITASKVFELRQRFATAASMGSAVNFGTNEVYSQVYLRKVA